MTSIQDLTSKAEALRQAVCERRYLCIQQLVQEYMLAATQANTPGALLEARELIEWARRLLLVHRATLAARLAKLVSTPRAYGNSPQSRPARRTWQIRG